MITKRRRTVRCSDLQSGSRLVPTQQLSFRIGVYAVIIERGKVLLQRSYRHTYHLPGGSINKGEELTAGLLREVREETGYRVRPKKLLDIATTFFEPIPGHPCHALSIYYSCLRQRGRQQRPVLDAIERAYVAGFDWVPLSQLSKIKFDGKGVQQAIMLARKV